LDLSGHKQSSVILPTTSPPRLNNSARKTTSQSSNFGIVQSSPVPHNIRDLAQIRMRGYGIASSRLVRIPIARTRETKTGGMFSSGSPLQPQRGSTWQSTRRVGRAPFGLSVPSRVSIAIEPPDGREDAGGALGQQDSRESRRARRPSWESGWNQCEPYPTSARHEQ